MMRLNEPTLRLLHSYLIDAMVTSDLAAWREAAEHLGGISCRAIFGSLSEGRLRIRPMLDDVGQVQLMVELVDTTRAVQLLQIAPSVLGLDAEQVRKEFEPVWVDELTQIIEGFA